MEWLKANLYSFVYTHLLKLHNDGTRLASLSSELLLRGATEVPLSGHHQPGMS